MRTDTSILLACAAVLWSVNPGLCAAQEKEQQSPAQRHATKARDYANRDEDRREKDTDRSTIKDGKAPGAGEVPASVNKALEEGNQTFKSLEQSLELLGK